MNIDEFIASQMQDKIVRRSDSPLAAIVLLLIGVAALVASFTASLSDSLETALLTIGFLLTVTGLIWAILCMTKVLWHYHYIVTGKPMKKTKRYLTNDDFRRCTECLNNNDYSFFNSLAPVVSSNNVLYVLKCTDDSLALLQAGREETSVFEPSTSVITLNGTEVNALLPLS